MKAWQTAALAELNISVESYCVEAPDLDDAAYDRAVARGISIAPIWGLELTRERGGASKTVLAVIEHTPRARDYNQDGKYHVRKRRSVSGMERAPSLSGWRTQREAIAYALRLAYNL